MAGFKVFTSKTDVQTALILTRRASLGPLVLRLAKDMGKIRGTGQYTREDVAGISAEAELVRLVLLACDVTDLGLSDEAAQFIQEACARYEESVKPMLVKRSRELAG